MLNYDEWNKLYSIEEKIETITYTQDDVKYLMSIIYKLNGNIIDPRTHNYIQKMIDSRGIPEADIDFNEESKKIVLDYLGENFKLT